MHPVRVALVEVAATDNKYTRRFSTDTVLIRGLQQGQDTRAIFNVSGRVVNITADEIHLEDVDAIHLEYSEIQETSNQATELMATRKKRGPSPIDDNTPSSGNPKKTKITTTGENQASSVKLKLKYSVFDGCDL